MSHRALSPEQFEDFMERRMRGEKMSSEEQVQMVSHAKRHGFKWVEGEGAVLEHPDGRRIELH